jgi:phosphoribosyl 1,2-cyclic phosphate phosphodiesterase
VDALLVTHAHADHVLGMDDIRRYNTIQKSAIPVYSSPETAVELRRIFGYVFRRDLPPGTYRPDLRFMEVEGPFQAGEVRITPLPVEHADAGTLGFRLEAEGRTLGYVPDCKRMADEVVARLAGVDVMILDALRHRPHSTHLTVADSVALLQRIRAKRSFLIHMCHDLDHDATQRGLPAGIEVSWDGLWLEW